MLRQRFLSGNSSDSNQNLTEQKLEETAQKRIQAKRHINRPFKSQNHDPEPQYFQSEENQITAQSSSCSPSPGSS